MKYAGLADEAAPDLEGQIKATKALGWSHIEARSINSVQWHELPEKDFEEAADLLEKNGIGVNCLASGIANWASKITDPFEITVGQARRAIKRMKRLGTSQVRVMSFVVMEDRDPKDQMQEERFRRMRELQQMFSSNGLEMLHENCWNYGGMSYEHTLELLEKVPGMKLVFDTGNPVVNWDRRGPKPWKRQDALEFYRQVKPYIRHVQVKDGWQDPNSDKHHFTFPGEGTAKVKEIVADLLASGYDGFLSIEPHMVTAFHDPKERNAEERQKMFDNYVEYGRRLEALVKDAATLA